MKPVKWDLPKIWALAVVMGIELAIATWILAYVKLRILSTSRLSLLPCGKQNTYNLHWTCSATFFTGNGVVQITGGFQEIIFLEVSLTENWLIFITRSTGPVWETLPSWQLAGAVFSVDVIATIFSIFGFFGTKTDVVTVVIVVGVSYSNRLSTLGISKFSAICI
jgi:H+-transporting ATPase